MNYVANPEDKYHPTLEINFLNHPFRQANTLTQAPKIFCFVACVSKILAHFDHGPPWNTKYLSKLKNKK